MHTYRSDEQRAANQEQTPPAYLTVGDMHALCEDFICSSENTYLLSLIGSREAIRAVRALLVKGERGVIRFNRTSKNVMMGDANTLLSEPLKGKDGKRVQGQHVGVILADRLKDGLAVAAEREAEMPAIFRGAFEKTSDVPSHETWAAWMWQKAHELEVCTPLESRLRLAYLVGDLAPLEDALRRGVRGGVLCA